MAKARRDARAGPAAGAAATSAVARTPHSGVPDEGAWTSLEGSGSPQEAMAALEAALRARAGAIADVVVERWHAARPMPGPLRPQAEGAIRQAAEAAVGAVAACLGTGDAGAQGQSELWGAVGESAFLLSLTMAEVTKMCLWWRDLVIEAVTDLAATHGVGRPVVERIEAAVRQGADVSLVRISQGFELTRTTLTEQLAEKQAFLDHQALHDPLTGLANRALLSDRLSRALHVSNRLPARPAVVLLDLDRFKAVNDSAGHSAGDHLLVEVATRLRKAVRPSDTVARLGGDEFVVLFEDLGEPEHDADAAATRILASLRDPFRVAGRTLFVTASVGIAVARPGETSEEVLGHADQAMYRAKRGGRARVEPYDPSIDREARRRAEFAHALHRALPDGQLSVVYQPVRELSTGREVGREALLRWHHPVFGAVAAADLVPAAEETGTIIGIGRWILGQSCSDCAAWRAHGAPDVCVSVNVSGRQLEDEAFTHDVAEALAASGLPPAALTLELTESLLVAGRPEARATLEHVQAQGVRVAIDDFGTGYSSLSWLARLPIDVLKIDRSFVAALGRLDRESAIVAAMVRLGHTLGLTVVAEGVETDAQLRELAEIGCDQAQGYLLGRPSPLRTGTVHPVTTAPAP